MGIFSFIRDGLYAVVKDAGDTLSDLLYPTPKTPMQRYKQAEKKKVLTKEQKLKKYREYKSEMEKVRGKWQGLDKELKRFHEKSM